MLCWRRGNLCRGVDERAEQAKVGFGFDWGKNSGPEQSMNETATDVDCGAGRE